MEQFIFYFIAVCLCVFALLTVLSRDIFHSAVWLSLALMSVSGVYFYLGAEFLGVIQILVYVGGIVTLFVFAIKLTAHIGDKSIRQVSEQVLPSSFACLILFALLFFIINATTWAKPEPASEVLSLKSLGQSLLTGYVLPFEFISLLLLAAMVGAIVIGKVKR